MERKLSLPKTVSRHIFSFLALALPIIWGFLLVKLLSESPPYSLRIWEIAIALVLSIQSKFSSSLEQLIQSLLPARLSQNRLFQRWVIPLIPICLIGLLIFLFFRLLGPAWDRVLFIFSGPAALVFVAGTLIIMGLYISGRFS